MTIYQIYVDKREWPKGEQSEGGKLAPKIPIHFRCVLLISLWLCLKRMWSWNSWFCGHIDQKKNKKQKDSPRQIHENSSKGLLSWLICWWCTRKFRIWTTNLWVRNHKDNCLKWAQSTGDHRVCLKSCKYTYMKCSHRYSAIIHWSQSSTIAWFIPIHGDHWLREVSCFPHSTVWSF